MLGVKIRYEWYLYNWGTRHRVAFHVLISERFTSMVSLPEKHSIWLILLHVQRFFAMSCIFPHNHYQFQINIMQFNFFKIFYLFI